jgi:hypothetical protein
MRLDETEVRRQRGFRADFGQKVGLWGSFYLYVTGIKKMSFLYVLVVQVFCFGR